MSYVRTDFVRTSAADLYLIQIEEVELALPFTYKVRVCEGACEASSLKKCTTNGTFCYGNGACKVDRGVCACDFIDWSAEMEKLPSYLQGVAKVSQSRQVT